MKIKLILIIIIINCSFSYAKAQYKVDSRYVVSLLYLKSNMSINKKIKKVFSYTTKKKKKYVDFNFYGEISFIDISYFENQLHSELYEFIKLDKELITNRNQYDVKYSFDSYIDESLVGLLDSINSNLFIRFSKPVNNYIIAEILDRRMNHASYIKMGNAAQILFIFNENGTVKDVIFSSFHYN